MDYIATYKDRFGVEPIVEVLNEHGITIALSTYYEHAARSFGPTAAELEDAYAANEVKAHALLGGAMSVFHDHCLLGSDEILDATTNDLSDSDLHLQPERVRLTPVQVSLHDMSELWSGFATGYRVSQAYEACVVLIDSTRD
ncbi:MAG: DUF4255 domain-containing protein, partial [Actinophytocola sp.]|nr:DUF4255 domain-containing protein [Actinophytocola sp.]